MLQIAIIGAGIAGAALAYQLQASVGATITLFEKARGVGGRLSCRRKAEGVFELGAADFSPRYPEVDQWLESLKPQVNFQPWWPETVVWQQDKPSFALTWEEQHYHLPAGMNTLVKTLLAEAPLYLRTQIAAIEADNDCQYLLDTSGNRYGPFDWVIATCPAPQTQTLMPTFASSLNDVDYFCRMILMLAADSPFIESEVMWCKGELAEWLIQKQTANGTYLLTVQTKLCPSSMTEWWSLSSTQQRLLLSLAQITGKTNINDLLLDHHIWRYAQPQHALSQQSYLIDPTLKQAVCGDVFIHGSVAGAIKSALALAQTLSPLFS